MTGSWDARAQANRFIKEARDAGLIVTRKGKPNHRYYWVCGRGKRVCLSPYTLRFDGDTNGRGISDLKQVFGLTN